MRRSKRLLEPSGRKVRPCPALPPEIWARVLGFLCMLDLVRAGPTCRGFQQFLAERVREAVNRCLSASQQRWPNPLIQGFADMAACTHNGLHPISLQPVGAGSKLELHEILAWADKAGCFVMEERQLQGWNKLDGPGLHLWCHSAGCWLARFDFMSIYESTTHEQGMPRGESSQGLIGELADVRAALGLLLCVGGVQKQEVVREGREALRCQVVATGKDRLAELEISLLNANAEVGNSNMSSGASSFQLSRRQVWQALFREPVIGDALAVGLALHSRKVVLSEFGGVMRTAVFQSFDPHMAS